MDYLIDYAEVISHPFAEEAFADLAARADVPYEEFHRRYWDFRVPYDVGSSAEAYWARVYGRPVTGEELTEVIRVDVGGWTHLNADTVAVLRELHGRGDRLTLLSNAPHELADAIEALPELEVFDALVFSARIGAAKPDPAAFEAALAVMECQANEVVFIDDREANVAGARAVGLDARLYTDAAALRADLLG